MFPVGYWPNSLPPGVIRLDAHTTWSSCRACRSHPGSRGLDLRRLASFPAWPQTPTAVAET